MQFKYRAIQSVKKRAQFTKEHPLLVFLVAALLVAALANLWLEWQGVAEALQSVARTITRTEPVALLALVCVAPVVWSLWQPFRCIRSWPPYLAGWTGLALLQLVTTGERELIVTTIVSAWVVGSAFRAAFAGVHNIVRDSPGSPRSLLWDSKDHSLTEMLAWAFVAFGFLVIDRWGSAEVPFLTEVILTFLPVASYLEAKRQGATAKTCTAAPSA